MALYNYRSTDDNAPVLDGQAGSLLGLFLAILTDGYNFHSIGVGDMTSSGGTTVSVAAPLHGLRTGQVIRVVGEDTGEYNVIATEVTVVDPNNYEYEVSLPPSYSPATSATSIDVVVAPISSTWTTPFSAANEATFDSGVVAYALDDTGTTNARIRGFLTVSASGVAEASGTEPFPLDADVSGGLYIMKSATANGTVRPWHVFSDGNYVHLIIEVSAGVHVRYGFGAFTSLIADTYNFALEGNVTASNSTNPDTHLLSMAATPGIYTLRDSDQTTPAGNPGRAPLNSRGGPRMGGSGPTYPIAGFFGGILLDRVIIEDPDTTLETRGFTSVYGFGSTVTFEYFDGNPTNDSCFVIETSAWLPLL